MKYNSAQDIVILSAPQKDEVLLVIFKATWPHHIFVTYSEFCDF